MTIEQAIEFQKDGWAVLPLRLDKTPWLPKGEHEVYLERAATEDEIRSFWKRFPGANVGLACGKISGRTVVDIDDGEDIFPETRTVLTPTGGIHKIYQYSPAIKNSVGSHYKGIDTRNDKGYIVAAGAHCEYTKKGKQTKGDYVIVNEIDPQPFPDVLFQTKLHEGEGFDPAKLLGVKDGGRNNSAASVIGLLVQGKPKSIQVPLWELAKSWNANNKPPLDEQELLTIFNSITEREWSKPKEETKLIDGLKITKLARDYVVKIPVPNGIVWLKFAEIIRSRQSFETVITVQLIHEKEGSLPAFEQRIDLNSASAISNLCSSLNAAYGNKKDGYNWTLILNRGAIAMKKLVLQEKKALVAEKNTPYETSVYLVEHFLEPLSPTLIHGDGSTGKSYLCLYMVACAALKKDFFGKKTEFFKTLYIDHESSFSKLSNRMHRISNALGVPFYSVAENVHWYKPEGSIANEQEIIARMVEEGGYKCIIVDAGAAASGGSPMDEQAVLRLFSALDNIPCAKLIIHHEPKGTLGVADDKAYYGTTFWRNASRIVWRLKREEKNGTQSIIKATNHKSNDDNDAASFTYSMSFSQKDSTIPTVEFNIVDDFDMTDHQKIINFLIDGEADEKSVVDAVGLPRATIQRRLDELMTQKKIERKRVGKKYLYFVQKMEYV